MVGHLDVCLCSVDFDLGHSAACLKILLGQKGICHNQMPDADDFITLQFQRSISLS